MSLARLRARYRRNRRPLHARSWFQALDWTLAAVAVAASLYGIVTGFGV